MFFYHFFRKKRTGAPKYSGIKANIVKGVRKNPLVKIPIVLMKAKRRQITISVSIFFISFDQ